MKEHQVVKQACVELAVKTFSIGPQQVKSEEIIKVAKELYSWMQEE